MSLSSTVFLVISFGSVIALIEVSRSNSCSKPILAAIPFLAGLISSKLLSYKNDKSFFFPSVFEFFQLFEISDFTFTFDSTSVDDVFGLITTFLFYFLFLSSILSE